MSRDGLTGSRIRERRQIAGMRQADLARKIGISASYLNLIEHNRRRIGGKLLLELAEVLGVEASMLSEGAEAALIAGLREAEASAGVAGAELDRIEEFAGRFPGWAQVLAESHRRTLQLEQAVEGLNDRLAHDPDLAASVHEVLSTAASIRSTASILAETDPLPQEWLTRFHGNINEDSARLAESSRALAGFLESGQARQDSAQMPQDEVDAFMAAHQYSFDGLETGGGQTPEEITAGADLSPAAQDIAGALLADYAADARQLPLADLRAALERAGGAPDPVALAARSGAPVAAVLRRLACLPELQAGYVMCDRAGSLIWRKAVPGFVMPRFGAACPLWPVFAALTQPGSVIRGQITQLGRQQARFDCFAVSESLGAADYNAPPLLRAGMLLLPAVGAESSPVTELGSACRVCPSEQCAGRREPSVLMGRV